MTAPTERELDALKILWTDGRATVRAIWDRLRERDPALAYTSVLSLLQSMEQKGLVRHEEKGRAYEYLPCTPRDETVQSLARGFLDRVFDGAVDEFVAHTLAGSPPSAETLERLEKLLAEAKRKAARKRRGDRP
jgi:predicted transcriptional regulator